ncbi:GNAT family N-acetyltransferase [Pusillimonas sp. MFBS29]|uniref:bifunctional acetate--CoA ligase family protein/GNAT family N-acetyltransferase n=1 Tax=Pusillimonas sp. MFBS29 TaxID=2886690 RepID=UPI001D11556F|nr:GNAT family N-acetyltransferase [Pusillimonas sp. MFBS29]MCC2597040.1 GNAT family N-acetyltransferase [Pusillimonas sp. MFBS29]
MPRHRLAALFEPTSVLVLADHPLPVEHAVPKGLQHSITFVDAGTEGLVTLPDSLAGVTGQRLDLAVVCLPSARLPAALDALRVHRPRGLILLLHPQVSGDPVEDMVYCRSWGNLNDCAVLGPRAFGAQRPHLGVNFSQQPEAPLAGRVALIAQSRSITAAVLDWAEDISLGFSTVVSVGDEAIVDVADVLDYLAMDARTDSIALYLEEASSSRRFYSALRAAASIKPVVVLKAGHSSGQAAQEAVFNALLRRAGAVRIQYFVQLFSALKVMVYNRRPRGRRIALFSNGQGAAQLALDVISGNEAVLRAELSAATVQALGACLEPAADIGNPIVTYAGLGPDVAQGVMDILLADPGVDGVLALLCPDPLSDLQGVARQLADLAPNARKPIVTCFLGDASMRPLRHMLDDIGTPAFRTPESAANAFGILSAYHYNQTLAQQMLPPEPLGKPPSLDQARALVGRAQSERRTSLDQDECRQLLSCFHIPLQYTDSGADCDHDPGWPMAIRVQRDSNLGPYIMFGAGGQPALMANAHEAVELPPLNSYLARKLVLRSSLWSRVLSRELSPSAFECLLDVLERVSGLVSELPGLESLSIDPLYVDDSGLSARGVSVTLTSSSMLVSPETSGYRHMAIHPYPRRLVQSKTFSDGMAWMLRPIRPEDAEALQTFIRGLSDQSRYMRFVSMMRELTPRMLARYTHIDYDRELALVATVQVPNPENRGFPQEQIVGFAHYLRNADGRGAEYALVIGDDWQRRGLGAQLMRGLIDAAQEQGLTYIDGLVLSSNQPMLGLMTYLGFQVDADRDDPTMRRVWLDLGETRQYS